jgi:hypothetical protein
MASTDQLYVVEWSPSAKQIHIQSINQTIENNLHAINNYEESKFVPDYLIVAVAENRDEAMKIADEIEEKYK